MGLSGACASAATSDQPDIIPADMDELARNYYDLIIGMIRKAGIPDQDADDAAQYILERLARTDVIGQFDPEHVTVHQGKPVKTRFSTFLGAKVLLYCRGERGRVYRRNSHELQILDAPEDGSGLGELLGTGAACDDYSGLDAAEFIARMRGHLAAVPPRSRRDTCDLVALFDEIVAEVSAGGGFTYAGIQARFGISGTTAGAWLARLRQALSCATGRPLAVIGGVALTREQVAAAVTALREAPGIMVAQPLKKAGHPLAQAAKGWYHEFSAAEIRKFPALAVEPGTHRKPAGHVKTAVIHRLERILSEAGVRPLEIPAPRLPDPEPASPEDEFEAALWRFIRDAEDMDRIKALARRAYAVSALWASAFTSFSATGSTT
jgi:DNA-directed RNA polymerase specialized sigma24 family protein